MVLYWLNNFFVGLVSYNGLGRLGEFIKQPALVKIGIRANVYMNLGTDYEDYKYFRNLRNLFDNLDYWINNNPSIKSLRSALETLALEKYKRELFYKHEQETINNFISSNLESHSKSKYDSLINSEIEHKEAIKKDP